jgi:hypothetical protein
MHYMVRALTERMVGKCDSFSLGIKENLMKLEVRDYRLRNYFSVIRRCLDFVLTNLLLAGGFWNMFCVL